MGDIKVEKNKMHKTKFSEQNIQGDGEGRVIMNKLGRYNREILLCRLAPSMLLNWL